MELKILGSSGGKSQEYNPTCFLLDNRILIDAGSVIKKLDTSSICSEIKHLLLTHSHFDHIADLPFLVQLAFEENKGSFNIFASRESTDSIFSNIFNFEMWTNLFEISNGNDPRLKWNEYENLETINILNYHITPILVNHNVPTHGFIIEDGGSSFAYTSDTYTTDQFWEECNKKNNLNTVIIDVSYPSRMRDTADSTKHLTTDLFLNELDKLDLRDLNIYVTHIKPRLVDEVKQEINELQTEFNIDFLSEGSTISI